MTVHDRVQELLMSLAVDDIAEPDRVFAEQHLVACEQCRSDLDSLITLVPLLADLRQPAPADATPIEPSPLHRGRTGAAAIVAVAVLAVAASLVALILVTGGPDPAYRSEVRLSRSDSIAGGVVSFDELDDGVAVHLRMSGLREPPPGGMYEVWLENVGGAVISIGTFSATGTGDVSVTLHGAGRLADFQELIVTIEPDMIDPNRNGLVVVLTNLPRG